MDWQDHIHQMAKRFGGRGWVAPDGLRVYVRTPNRMIEGVLQPTLDLATIEADEQGQGALTRWLPDVENLAAEMGRVVYVENVLAERFQRFWIHRGYIPLGTAPFCYWKRIEHSNGEHR